MMKINYINEISAENYTLLRASVGFREIPLSQAVKGLRNTSYLIAALDGSSPVGMARLLWDGGYTAFLADVIVHPDYQGLHIGKTMVDKIIDYVYSQMEPGDKVLINLEAAKGKEPFYLKFGFEQRPNEEHGAGMSQWIEK